MAEGLAHVHVHGSVLPVEDAVLGVQQEVCEAHGGEVIGRQDRLVFADPLLHHGQTLLLLRIILINSSYCLL